MGAVPPAQRGAFVCATRPTRRGRPPAERGVRREGLLVACVHRFGCVVVNEVVLAVEARHFHPQLRASMAALSVGHNHRTVKGRPLRCTPWLLLLAAIISTGAI